MWLVNIYALSGAEKRRERRDFFNLNLPHLLQGTLTTVIRGGDFNCVLAKADVTGHFNFSRALNTLVKGYDLVDMWATAPERGVYTHYRRQGAARLDRIYVSRHFSRRKRGTETAVTAFTDHLAVILSIALNVTAVRRGRSYWKMNAALLREQVVQETLLQRWKGWRRLRNFHPPIVMWWAVAYPGILFGGGSTNSVEDRENGDLEAVDPLSGVLEAAVIWYKKFHFI